MINRVPRASKVAVGIIPAEDAEAIALERWFARNDNEDLRKAPDIEQRILEFLKLHDVISVAMVNEIMGCPHEEGVDYPNDEGCPFCPFWAHRARSVDLIETAKDYRARSSDTLCLG